MHVNGKAGAGEATVVETVMLWHYQNANCSLKNKFIALFIIIFGTLLFPTGFCPSVLSRFACTVQRCALCYWRDVSLSVCVCLCVCVLDITSNHDPCSNGWTDRDSIWGVDSGGPEPPRGRGKVGAANRCNLSSKFSDQLFNFGRILDCFSTELLMLY